MKKFAYFVSGCLVTALLMTSIPVFAETTSKIDAIFGRVKLMVNGQAVDKETLLYNGTTYVPLRAAAEVLGKEIAWDGNTNTAYIDEKGTNRTFDISSTKIIYYSEFPTVPSFEACTGIEGVVSMRWSDPDDKSIIVVTTYNHKLDEVTPEIIEKYKRVLEAEKFESLSSEQLKIEKNRLDKNSNLIAAYSKDKVLVRLISFKSIYSDGTVNSGFDVAMSLEKK